MCLTLSRRQVCCAPAAAPSQPVLLSWRCLRTPHLAPRASFKAGAGAGRARSKLPAKSQGIRRLEPRSALAKAPGEPGYTLDIGVNVQAPKAGACKTEARLQTARKDSMHMLYLQGTVTLWLVMWQQKTTTGSLTFCAPAALEELWRQLTEALPALRSPKLRRRVRGALLILAASRLGTFVPIPGVDLSALPEMEPWSAPATTVLPNSSPQAFIHSLSKSSVEDCSAFRALSRAYLQTLARSVLAAPADLTCETC